MKERIIKTENRYTKDICITTMVFTDNTRNNGLAMQELLRDSANKLGCKENDLEVSFFKK